MPAPTIQIATAAVPAIVGGQAHAGKAAGAAGPLGAFESILGGMVDQPAGTPEAGVPAVAAKGVGAPAPEAALLQAAAGLTPAEVTIEAPVVPEQAPAAAKTKILAGAKAAAQPKPESLAELAVGSALGTPAPGATTTPAAQVSDPPAEPAAAADEKVETSKASPEVATAAVDPNLLASLVAAPSAAPPPARAPAPRPSTASSGEAGGDAASPGAWDREPAAALPPVLDGKFAIPDPAGQPARPADGASPRPASGQPAAAPSTAAIPTVEPTVTKAAPPASEPTPNAPPALQAAAEPVPSTSQAFVTPPQSAPGQAAPAEPVGKPVAKTARATRDATPPSPSPSPSPTLDGAAPKPNAANVQTAEAIAPDARQAKIAPPPAAGGEASSNNGEPGLPAGTAAPQAPAASTAHAAAPPPPTPVRGSPETVASLAAQMVKKLGARTSHFDVQLDPVGLGRVNVRVEIGADGQVRAAMSFDNPQAAAELKSRASELQRALADSGFDVGSSGLSFDVAGDPGNSGRGQQNAFQNDDQAGSAFRGRAFAAALETAGEAAQSALSNSPYLRLTTPSGVDVRI